MTRRAIISNTVHGMAGRVERRDSNGETIVAIVGDVDMADVSDLRALLHEVAGDRRRVVVDLSEATFVDSAVIGALLLVDRDGCHVVLRGAHGEPRRALDIAGVLDVVEVED
jgi:anti-anti-sigma factor